MALPTPQIDQTPAHKMHKKELNRKHQEWLRHRNEGFVRCHQSIEVDDKRIALKTGMHFFELKSFGSTLAWSLNKVEVMNAFHATNRTHVEFRLDPFGKEQRYIVEPRHLRVYEYNPVTGHKYNITPKREKSRD